MFAFFLREVLRFCPVAFFFARLFDDLWADFFVAAFDVPLRRFAMIPLPVKP
jgi:hypothetical protein